MPSLNEADKEEEGWARVQDFRKKRPQIPQTPMKMLLVPALTSTSTPYTQKVGFLYSE